MRQWYEIDAAELLNAVADVVIDVTLLLHDGALSGPALIADGEMVGKRTGGHEHRRLFAQNVSQPFLHFLHHSPERIVVRFDPCAVGYFGQPSDHQFRGLGLAIPPEHDGFRGLSGLACHCDGRC